MIAGGGTKGCIKGCIKGRIKDRIQETHRKGAAVTKKSGTLREERRHYPRFNKRRACARHAGCNPCGGGTDG